MTREQIIDQIKADAKKRNEDRKLRALSTETGKKRLLFVENIATLDAILEDIDSSIDGSVMQTYNFSPLANKLISIILTLQYATKSDREKIDPSYYELISEHDRQIVIDSMGMTPYFADAIVVESKNGTYETIEPAKIINAGLTTEGEWEFTSLPDVDTLVSTLELIAFDLDLLDPDFSDITDRSVRRVWQRALKRALTEKKLSESLESVDSTVVYEE